MRADLVGMYSGTLMSVDCQVLDSVEAVEPIAAQWDELAVRFEKPYCAPAWLLAWWRHAAPPNARLRIVVARDGDRLLGVAPFYAVPWLGGLWTWSMMCTDTTSRIEPLAVPEMLGPVARAMTAAIDRSDPPPDRIRLEGLPADSPWPELLRTSWPGPDGWLYSEPPTPAPTVALLGGSIDDWLAARSSNFRQQMRRSRRKLDKLGAEFRVARTPEEIDAALVDFERLHAARWDWRGGSTAFTPGSDKMLADVGRELAASDRFQIVSLVLDGKTINSQLFVGAGGEVSYWNGGFDDDYANLKPSLVALVEAVSMSLEQGRTRFDLGPGGQEYKYRFSDSVDSLLWVTLIPRRGRYRLARLAFAPKEIRHEVSRRLTRERKDRLREVLRRPAR